MWSYRHALKWPVKGTIKNLLLLAALVLPGIGKHIVLYIPTFLLTFFFACDYEHTVLACQVAATLTLFTSGLYGAAVSELLC